MKYPLSDNHDDFYRIFVALDDNTKENGCMIFIPGYNYGELNFNKILSIHSYQKNRITTKELDKVIKNNKLEYYELNSGECILFNSLIPHCSHSNQTNLHRRTLQMQLIRKGTLKKNKNEIDKYKKDRNRN